MMRRRNRRSNSPKARIRRPPKWLEGGAFTATVIATFFSYASVPVGGLGVLALLFGGWLPGAIFVTVGLAMWFTGKYLIAR